MKDTVKSDQKITVAQLIRQDFSRYLFIVIAFTLMTVVSYFYVRRIVETKTLDNVHESLRTAEMTVRLGFRQAEVTLINSEQFVMQILERGESMDEIRKYLVWQTEVMGSGESGISGLEVIYGVFDYIFIFGNDWWDAVPSFPNMDRPWYKAAIQAGNGIGYATPYKDYATGKTIISISKTLYDKNEEVRGVIAVDLDISELADYILSLQSQSGGYGMLGDQYNCFFVHPFTELYGKSIYKISNVNIRGINDFMANRIDEFSARIKNINGTSEVIVFHRLYNGWPIGVAIPANTYNRESIYLAIVLGILGIVFFVGLSLILVSISLAKARADRQNREKTSFLARMSHEIRTPMNSIMGVAELIRRKTILPEVREYAGILIQEGQNLLAIINDILDFSKIEANRLQIDKREYRIESVINDVINLIYPRAVDKSLDFVVVVDPQIPKVLLGDDTRVRQILTNLLSNAVKYTHKGHIYTDVGIEMIKQNKVKIRCVVQDTGIGIKNEDIGRLFEDFYRINTVVDQGIEGTGLGLAIARTLCRAMEGDILVESEFGKGSVFRASFVQEAETEEPAASIINPDQKRVLFFDQRPLHTSSALAALKSLGVYHSAATGFDEFKKTLESGNFNYAFISSQYAMDCVFLTGSLKTPVRLVLIAEAGEVPAFMDTASIIMPIYSITVANVLNNETREKRASASKFTFRFTAPSAKVLIVDDITTNLKVAKELMSPYNMTVHTCQSGAEALNLVKQSNYDIIFMDHMMPVMDGIEAAERIRAMENGDGYFRNLPVIALTANAMAGQKEIFLQHGINDFIAKPIDVRRLDEILERWLPEEKRIPQPKDNGS